MTDSSISDVPAFADALSPLERAAAGLQDELSVFEIALLAFPDKAADQKRLTDFLLETIKAGRLAAYGNPDGWVAVKSYRHPLSGSVRAWIQVQESDPWDRCKPHQGTQRTINNRYSRDVRFDGDNCLIRRADYLALLATPPARGIPKPDGWKAPQDEPASSAPTLPQGETDKSESGAAAKQAGLESLLAEIDKRAAEQGAGFDRSSLPGTKEEFARLLKAYCPVFRYVVTVTVADYLKGKCKFQRGAQSEQGKGKAVWALFPEYDLK